MKPSVLITLTRGCEDLAHALTERADVEIINFHPHMAPFYEAKGIPFRQLFDFIDDRRRTEMADEAGERLAHLSGVFADPAFRREWSASSTDPSEWDAVSAAIQQSLQTELLSSMIVVDVLRRCAGEVDLRCIVVQQDISRDTRTLIHAGRRLGVPSLHVLHGSPCGAVGAINLFSPPAADMVAVFSESTRAVYESLGTPSDRIAVTGNFEWDVYAGPFRTMAREESCESLGLDPSRPVVTYALTYAHRFSAVSTRCRDYVNTTSEAVARAFAELADQHPDWQFVLRPHPNDLEADERIERIVADSGIGSLTIDRELSAPASVAITDVYVCCQSNMAVEAVLAGKPAISVALRECAPGFFDEGIGYMYPEDGAIVTVSSPDGIAPAIEAAMTDPETQQRFMSRRPDTITWFNGCNDGKATERVRDLIFDLMERGCAPGLDPGRYADCEVALARAVPDDAETVLVVGGSAPIVADLVHEGRPDCAVDEVRDPGEAQADSYSCVLLTEPVPPTGAALSVLDGARSRVGNQGVLVAVFRHGGDTEARIAFSAGGAPPVRPGFEPPSLLGQFSRQGLEVVLSRSGFDVVGIETHSVTGVVAWIVTARARGEAAGPWRQARDAQRAVALDLNRKGETFFAAGHYDDAAQAFLEALEAWDGEALIHNNLGAALHAAGRPDAAWDRFLTALHCDPAYVSARDNLRGLAAQLGRRSEAEAILSIYGAGRPGNTCP